MVRSLPDLSIAREIRLGGGRQLQLRVDRDPRRIQVQVRFSF